MGLIDDIIKEPLGGAHRNIHDTIFNTEQYIKKTLRELSRLSINSLVEKRYQKLRLIGTHFEKKNPLAPQTPKISIKTLDAKTAPAELASLKA